MKQEFGTRIWNKNWNKFGTRIETFGTNLEQELKHLEHLEQELKQELKHLEHLEQLEQIWNKRLASALMTTPTFSMPARSFSRKLAMNSVKLV